jgi:sugar lactone lactonase YvrE
VTTAVVLDGLDFGEGPRWHDGRLWFSDFYQHRVRALSPDGQVEDMLVLDGQPSGLGWLPDGRLLVVSMLDRRVLRLEPDGSLMEHADLSSIAAHHANDMVVDAAGRAYVGNFGFDLEAGAKPLPATLALVHPNGDVEAAATDLLFPHGSVITPDGSTLIVGETTGSRYSAFDIDADGRLTNRRVWAEVPGYFPDGCCLDADGAIWFADAAASRAVRVREGGEVVDQVTTGDTCFACMLGGDDGRSLYLLTASSPATPGEGEGGRGRIERTTVEVPHAGLP